MSDNQNTSSNTSSTNDASDSDAFRRAERMASQQEELNSPLARYLRILAHTQAVENMQYANNPLREPPQASSAASGPSTYRPLFGSYDEDHADVLFHMISAASAGTSNTAAGQSSTTRSANDSSAPYSNTNSSQD
ncbi:hypothetical protein IAR55_005630 [Kwoniella newhampshirensis]|uniref:Uncharacterized protein n=1 Tax=Kwoniella newhampshirensis TaxID=1651941 RepID=A0AAW0YUW0_9TREE